MRIVGLILVPASVLRLCKAVYPFPETELAALQSLYISADGPNWNWKNPYESNGNPWDFTQPSPNPCTETWQGITCTSSCDAVPCNVVSLSLSSYGLAGIISAEISNLTYLSMLDLSSNQLMGSIPDSIGLLTTLQVLYLDTNGLQFTIPKSIWNMYGLVSLELNDNLLTGSISTSVGNLKSLRWLVLYNNTLTGSIPDAIGSLVQLTYLNIFVNELTGTIPNSISNLTTLYSFQAYDNLLSGTLPAEIGSLQYMIYLTLNKNLLTGTIAPQLGMLNQLDLLRLSENAFSGSIPPQLGNMQLLTGLYLNYNQLTGMIPNALGLLITVLDFRLYNNYLTGTIPKALGELRFALVFDMRSNLLTGTIPALLGNLSRATLLDLGGNHLTGTIPSELGYLSKISSFSLAQNNLTGTIPVTITSCSSLTVLDLSVNQLTGTISEELRNLTALTKLKLNINYFTGTLPLALTTIISLTELALGVNRLTGTISQCLENLQNLQKLLLGGNYFTGAIPHELGNIGSLQFFSVANNHFSGNIPSSLGNTSLRKFQGSFNSFNGIIPSEFAILKRLQEFWVDFNFLTGTVPKDLGDTELFQYLSVAKNLLSGEISPSLCISVHLSFVNTDTNFLDGTLPSCLFELLYMKEVNVRNNLMSGRIKESTNASITVNSLDIVDLSANFFNGSLPAFSLYLRLNELTLSNNEFSGSMPSFSPLLLSLDISCNRIDGVFPETAFFSIEYFNVSHNLIADSLSCLLCDSSNALSNLLVLDASSNTLYGKIDKKCFPAAKNLSVLLLNDNQLSGQLDFIGTFSTLQFVDISNNKFSSSLPPNAFQPGNIVSFVANINCLTGSIPLSVCHNLNMSYLVLDGMGSASECNRQLFPRSTNHAYYVPLSAGTIPSCLLEFSNITVLHLSGMMLEGGLPNNVRLPNSLAYLSLSYNQLTGTIPGSYFEHNWVELDLSFNKFRGEVKSLTNDLNGTILSLQLNRLSGTIPSDLASLDNINILQGNMYSCESQLPAHDPTRNSYQCGSDYVNTGVYTWLCLTFVAVIAVSFLAFSGYDSRVINLYMHMRTDVMLISEPGKNTILLVLGLVTYTVMILLPLYLILKAASFGTFSTQYVWILSSCFLSGVAPALLLLFAWIGYVGLLCYGQQVKDASSSLLPNNSKNAFIIVEREQLTREVANTIFVAMLVTLVNFVYVYTLQQDLEPVFYALITISLSLFKTVLSIFASRNTTHNSQYETLCLLIYSLVVVPYVAEMIVSQSCFYYAILQAAPTVSSVIKLQTCSLFINRHGTYSTFALYLNGLSELVLCYPSNVEVSYDPPFVYSYTCSSSLVTNFALVFVLHYIFVCVKLWFGKALEKFDNSSSTPCHHCVNLLRRWLVENKLSAPSLFVSLMTDFALMITFGVLFPPLAIIIFSSILLRIVCFYDRWKQIDLKTDASIQEEVAQTKLHIQQDIDVGFRKAIPYLTFLAALFWSFTVFDTLGDVVGSVRASGAMVAMIVSPVCWLGGFYLHKRYVSNPDPNMKIVIQEKFAIEDGSVTSQDNPTHQQPRNSTVEMGALVQRKRNNPMEL